MTSQSPFHRWFDRWRAKKSQLPTKTFYRYIPKLVRQNVSYAAFLRYSEAFNVTFGDIVSHEAYVKIFVVKSKTDQYSESHWVHIARTSSVIFPVKILK